MHKILVLGPAWVGDMVMAQSLLKALHDLTPQNTQIDVLAPLYTFPLLERMPEVNQALPMPTLEHGELGLYKRYQKGRSLRAEQYDQVIVLQNSWKSGLIPFWAKIPKRTGWVGECRFGLLNDIRRLDKDQLVSMVSRYVGLAYPKGEEDKAAVVREDWFPSLTIDKTTVQKTQEKFSIDSSNQQPILALCPGAAFGSAKRWPETYFATLANQALKEGWEVWLFGSKPDKPVGDQIQALCNNQCRDFVGTTSLTEAIDLLSLTTHVVSNDSGLMHIAAALGRSVTAIYGPTPSEFAPPLSNRATILKTDIECRPCRQRECPLGHHRCMTLIEPEAVKSTFNLT